MSEKDAGSKKSRKERQRELRKLDKEISGGRSLIDYAKVNQRHMDDKRFERELKNKEILQEQADHGVSKGAEQAPSATYDAFMRMQTGQETRTIADKINDPNRVSWEQFRTVNADKLDIPGADHKKMVEYRAQLDAEREAALAKGRNRRKRKLGVSSSESEGEEGGVGDSDSGAEDEKGASSSSKRKKRKKEKKARRDKKSRKDKKHKSVKKSSRRSRKEGGDSGGSTDSEGRDDSEETKKRRRKDKKRRKKEMESEAKSNPKRLSTFLQESSVSGSDES